MVVSVVAWGAAIVAFGLVPRDWFPLALVLLAAAGWADVVSAVFRNTILQLVAPDAMRGRLSALHIAVVTSGPRLGDVEAGAVAAATSVRFSVVSGGLACIAGVAIMHAVSPVLARYRRGDGVAARSPARAPYLRRARPPPRAYPAGCESGDVLDEPAGRVAAVLGLLHLPHRLAHDPAAEVADRLGRERPAGFAHEAGVRPLVIAPERERRQDPAARPSSGRRRFRSSRRRGRRRRTRRPKIGSPSSVRATGPAQLCVISAPTVAGRILCMCSVTQAVLAASWLKPSPIRAR